MLVEKLGWEDFVNQHRRRGKLANLEVVPQLTRRLLCQYKHQGALVVLAEKVEQRGTVKPRSGDDHTGLLWITPLFSARTLPP